MLGSDGARIRLWKTWSRERKLNGLRDIARQALHQARRYLLWQGHRHLWFLGPGFMIIIYQYLGNYAMFPVVFYYVCSAIYMKLWMYVGCLNEYILHHTDYRNLVVSHIVILQKRACICMKVMKLNEYLAKMRFWQISLWKYKKLVHISLPVLSDCWKRDHGLVSSPGGQRGSWRCGVSRERRGSRLWRL